MGPNYACSKQTLHNVQNDLAVCLVSGVPQKLSTASPKALGHGPKVMIDGILSVYCFKGIRERCARRIENTSCESQAQGTSGAVYEKRVKCIS